MPARKKNMRGKGVAGDVVNFVRDNKLISRGLGMIPHPAGQVASQVAKMLGLGRTARRGKAPRKRRGQTGKGIFGDLGSGIGSVFGGLGNGVGSIAHGLFGGARKRKATKRVIKM